jgi:hypothetical protein
MADANVVDRSYLSLTGLTEYDALIKAEIAKKVDTETYKAHKHDDMYYTEAEVDGKLGAINDSISKITSGNTVVKNAEHAQSATNATNATNAKNAEHAQTAESAVNATTASKVGSSTIGGESQPIYLNSGEPAGVTAVGIPYGGTGATTVADARTNLDVYSKTEVNNKVSGHNVATDAHSDIRLLISELGQKVNHFLDVDEATTDELSEVLGLIKANKDTLDDLLTDKVNTSDIIDNLTTTTSGKVLSANQGVVLKGLIDALTLVVDGKSDAGHSHTISAGATDDDVVILSGTAGTNGVSYSASHANSGVTAGTYRSVTVNAKGHVTAGTNPTTLAGYGIIDAYTKSQTDGAISSVSDNLSKHTTDTGVHIGSDERSHWNTAYTHSQSNHIT